MTLRSHRFRVQTCATCARVNGEALVVVNRWRKRQKFGEERVRFGRQANAIKLSGDSLPGCVTTIKLITEKKTRRLDGQMHLEDLKAADRRTSDLVMYRS